MDSAAFAKELAALGFEEVLTRHWLPNQFIDTHTHPFEVRALVLEGELALGCDGQARTYRAGEIFTLKAGEPHTERYGPQGATYLVGRKR
jgi:hypothetical protein